jgi:hypothetical protein
MGRSLACAVVVAALLSGAALSQAVPPPAYEAVQVAIEKRIQGVLSLMGFQVVPDVTTMSLSVSDSAAGDPELLLGQIGAGFTWSDDFPLYLEGVIGYSRYDPQFVISDGSDTRVVPFQWNSATATAGIGWDFAVSDRLVIRPIASATIAYVASDAAVAGFILDEKLGAETKFLFGRSLNAWGYGGAVVLDFADYNDAREIDVELRYSHMFLETYGLQGNLNGSAEVGSVNLWARWRAPIADWTAFERPVRYALELTYSEFLYDQRDLLGFNRLLSLGAGLELDLETSRLIDRARVMGRYVFGNDVSGFSVGFAVTF